MSVIVGPLLPEPHYGRVEAMWGAVADEFGANGVTNPHPHFTLYGLAADADLDAVEAAVARVAADHDPFAVHTDGLGIFPGHHVWLPVAKSPALLDLHRDAVRALDGLAAPPTPYYEPERWFPHVALALRLDRERAGAVASFLLANDLEWSFEVDTVAVTRPPPGADEHELVATVEL